MNTVSTPIPTARNVLVVDNDELHQELLASILGIDGHVVRRAADGLEALALCKESRPDLIITDLIMPQMDGLVFIERLRQTMGDPPPIIVISAFEDRKSSILTMMEGAGDLFKKPFDVDELLQRVRTALATRESQTSKTGGAPG